MLRYALDWRLGPDAPEGSQAFSYHLGVRFLLWGLLGACVLELVAAHLLVRLFFGPVATWVVFAFSVMGVVYVVGLMRALARLPLLVSDEGVRVRAGPLIDHWLPISQVAGADCVINCGDTKRPGFLKASLLAYPNVVVEIDPPLTLKRRGRTEEITAIGLHPDDAAGFVTAVRQARATRLA